MSHHFYTVESRNSSSRRSADVTLHPNESACSMTFKQLRNARRLARRLVRTDAAKFTVVVRHDGHDAQGVEAFTMSVRVDVRERRRIISIKA